MVPSRSASLLRAGPYVRRFATAARAALVGAIAILAMGPSRGTPAAEPVEVVLELHPAAIDDLAPPPRLFPADPDLTPGNAAVILNGLYAERLGMVLGWREELREIAALPVGDPRIAATRVTSMIPDMIRAGRIRHADWNHPAGIDSRDIYLGDTQLAQRNCGSGLTIWIKQMLAEGDLAVGEEGIRTQLACARHIGNTPFLITALQGHAVAGHALDNVECLVSRPGCPNYRWSLSVLPPILFDAPSTLAWESRHILVSLTGPTGLLPRDDDTPAWQAIAREYFELFYRSDDRPDDRQRGELLASAAPLARDLLARQGVVSAEAADAMAPETAVMRMLLARLAEIGRRRRSAWNRPPSAAIAELAALDRLTAEIPDGIPNWGLALHGHVADYLFVHDFSRRAALLETVESLRHHAATHDGRLPATLADLEHPSHPDPVAGLPFTYTRGDDPATATLSLPDVPGVPEETQRRRSYTITMVTP